jgi:hypothetical protein
VSEPGYLPNDEKTLVLLYIAGENHCEVLHNCALRPGCPCLAYTPCLVKRLLWQDPLGAKRSTPARVTRQASPTATSVLGKRCPKDEWITIPVPALFDAEQEQLEENRRRACIPEKGSRYPLSGFAGLCEVWVCLSWVYQ